MHKSITFFIILMILVAASPIIAQDLNLSPYGYISINIPTEDGDEYQIQRARVGVTTAQLLENGTVKTKFEFDINSAIVKWAYGQFDKSLWQGTVSLVVGIHPNSVACLYPGPKNLRLTRWPDMLDHHTLYSTGTSIWYKKGNFTGRATHFNHNSSSFALTFYGLSGFWEKNTCLGGMFESPWTTRLLHPYMGGMSCDDALGNLFFIQNYVQLPYNNRLYGQYDFGDTKDSWLFGINHEFSTDCFIKCFYETRDEKIIGEVNFAFN
ncbi:MAG: hypothetical protein COV55_00610 [Candidatus Komeilibacteria bacterium CG11_big_fil_rev_8_21_14_0_20_36_20]|uniref:Uncharacterized protein n=1 Tax=Candidatus Komeilibacteria bacterium CG11_big_fil_rev_8_21_14_0_20_36_20 TaxID=1974477 RepID=A0A2H0NEB3_9BACT|nr:MAG: hypothetical protein COV55_00610 [Candidatus Komeilibacteria bacterium CG11_big_fil_rev_8_21_14_0_20_36_20]